MDNEHPVRGFLGKQSATKGVQEGYTGTQGLPLAYQGSH